MGVNDGFSGPFAEQVRKRKTLERAPAVEVPPHNMRDHLDFDQREFAADDVVAYRADSMFGRGAAAGAGVLGHFKFTKAISAVAANTLSPAAGWASASSNGAGAELVPPGNYVNITAAGLWAVSAVIVTQGQMADYFLELYGYRDGSWQMGMETTARSTNLRQVAGWHLNPWYAAAPAIINSGSIDWRLYHTAPAVLGGTVVMNLTRFALP